MKQRCNQSGVALVITLIMLSVITIIAVAFLALSQRERASLSQTLTATEAELMASSGLERAKSHVLAEVAAFLSTNTQIVGGRAFYTRPQGTDLAVSEAFTNDFTLYKNWTNMDNADYEALTNLFFDPQVPVFTTNRVGSYDLVDYLDLNRNGRFDPTGIIDEIDANGIKTGNTNFVIGDPQWIGVLARPNEPHSSSNRFIGRYAYIILPAGRTLDINFIHNRGKVDPLQNQYYRSQGHGSWEINLAAFLADLNSDNTYGWRPLFDYFPALSDASRGLAFDHASQILNFRYAGTNLWNAENLFGSSATNFQTDYVDEYANGWERSSDNDVTTVSWPGSPNPNQFFTVHDFFNRPPPQPLVMQGFQDRLRVAGTGPGTTNQHTFYRMLAQIGTDSAPEPMQVRKDRNTGRFNGARINLNYDNLEPYTADQFNYWTAETFFQTAADKLLQEYRFTINNNANLPLSVTNLPVYPTNYYTPAVHRVLQMTLNIFEASTTNHGATYPYYPTALKPVFTNENGGNSVKIMGYVRVPQNNWAITNALNWKDLSNATHRASLNGTSTNLFVYGVPVLIGARKGFPSFNEYIFQTVAQVERKVQIEKLETSSVATTNQAFFLGISNVVALEAWNSYRSNYPRTLRMVAGVEVSSSLTNNEGFVRGTPNNPNNPLFPATFSAFSAFDISPATSPWRRMEYQIPLPMTGAAAQDRSWTNEVFLPYSIYSSVTRTFVPTNQILGALERGTFPNTQWVLTTTNRLRFFMFDDGHLIDAVGLAPLVSGFNITEALHKMDQGGPNNPTPVVSLPNYWATNRVGGAAPANDRVVTLGLNRQIERAMRGTPQWGASALIASKEAEGFRAFLASMNTATNVYTNWWVPFVPQQQLYQHFVWEANDPLVHHISEDLNLKTNVPIGYSESFIPDKASSDIREKIGNRNVAYRPWNPGDNTDPPSDKNVDPEITDPNVRSSDSWDFPTNKFATIGMLGRIHRGSPWQTIYLKSDRPSDTKWRTLHQGGIRSNPTNDWQLADVFTVAQHPNASRGRLSVNQTNVAAWSAVLSGAEVPTLQGAGGAATVITNIIQPVAVDQNRTIEALVAGINARRGTMTGQVFSSISDLLGVRRLTMDSPFLQAPYVPNPPAMDATPLRDRHFEAIPETILSLVHAGDRRFVIYAFGQSLKPAPQSILTGGNFRGLVTNYEVSGELATRTVMRVELDERNNPPAAPLPRAVIETFNILPPD
jgi:hypothetical protein